MKKLAVCLAAVSPLILSGCMETSGGVPVTSTSERANSAADQTMYKPVEYKYSHIRGPALMVIPGQMKSNNATFTQKVTSNNIADYAELELGRANYRVLERADLGPVLSEVSRAYAMGDPRASRLFKRGKFKSTRYVMKFDILKAEPVAQATQGFDGRVLGSMLGAATGNYYAGAAAGSVKSEEASGVWVVGLRYKLIDASTSEQVATNYFEKKMEIGSKGYSVVGFSQGQKGGVTLDSMVQRLVQEAVLDIDKMRASSRPARSASSGADRAKVKKLQQALNDLGYNTGRPDGLPGKMTRSAVSAFQRDNGLKVTGRLDSSTSKVILEMAP